MTAFMTFIFNDGISNTLVAATYFFSNQRYTLTIDWGVILEPILTAFAAVIAGYVGFRLARRARPTREVPPSLPPPLPPV